MTVTASIDPACLLEGQLAQASPDLLRELLTTCVNTLMSAAADAVCGAAYGTVAEERANRRNGYRAREFDTRAGTIALAIPKLRQGTSSPEWLLERRKRAERARTSVVATCSLLGVSTRRMDKLLASLGITTLSKSRVSEMAKELDSHVEEVRTRSLTDAGPCMFVAADALVLQVREGGRVVGVHALVATPSCACRAVIVKSPLVTSAATVWLNSTVCLPASHAIIARRPAPGGADARDPRTHQPARSDRCTSTRGIRRLTT